MGEGALRGSGDIRQMSDPDFLAERRRVRETVQALTGRLAVEVLLSDEAALEDDDLAARRHALQDRLEALTRTRYGVA